MNQHTAHETAAAIELQAHAETLATAYITDEWDNYFEDRATARIAFLATALENERRKQNDRLRLIFISEDCLESVHKLVTLLEKEDTVSELSGLLESIGYEPPIKQGEQE